MTGSPIRFSRFQHAETCFLAAVPWLICITFFVAAILKFLALDELARASSALPMMPATIRSYFPIILPTSEILLAATLAIPTTRLPSMLVADVALVIFSGYLSWIMRHNPDAKCECFGPVLSLAKFGLIRNGLMLLLITYWVARTFLLAASPPPSSSGSG